MQGRMKHLQIDKFHSSHPSHPIAMWPHRDILKTLTYRNLSKLIALQESILLIVTFRGIDVEFIDQSR